MFEILEKFVKHLAKLDEYYVLRQEKEHIIIGTKIIIKEHKEFLGNVFQPRTQNVDKELPVFFLVTIAAKPLEIDKLFLKNKLPLLSINNKKGISTIEGVKTLLDEFVLNFFKS
ncbi:MAG: hypothetical protein RL662_1786 [Bacteroidota bacterium]|jgi:hypothetical protein